MTLPDINKTTFVAFTDISGFKMLSSNQKKAERALGKFYNEGFNILKEYDCVKGLFVSDCGILIVDGNDNNDLEGLKHLLMVLKRLNSAMLQDQLMLTTSIAYGRFVYSLRKEHLNMEKKMLYGQAYLSAFLDNESGKPKIEPGQCRILVDGLPDSIRDNLNYIVTRQENKNNIYANDQVLSLLKNRSGDENHLYYYWNVDCTAQIEQFEEYYTDAYQLKYKGFLSALKRRY